MNAVPRWLRILLLALPRGFRTEYGDEIRAHVAWMRERHPSGPGAVRVTAHVVFDILRVALSERLAIARTMASNSAKVSGHLLAGGALLTFVGASLGFGAGSWIGFALVPPALVIFAHGMVARAIAASLEHRWMVGLAGLTGACAIALALLVVFRGFDFDLFGISTSRAMPPAFIGFVVAASLFGLTGMLLRQIPPLPAALAGVGGVMLLAGVLDLEGVAELGFWLWVAGWVALGILPWTSAPRAVHPERRV